MKITPFSRSPQKKSSKKIIVHLERSGTPVAIEFALSVKRIRLDPKQLPGCFLLYELGSEQSSL